MVTKSYNLKAKPLLPFFIFILFLILLDIHSAFEEHHDEHHCNICLLVINELEPSFECYRLIIPYNSIKIYDSGLTSIKSMLSIKSIKPRGPPTTLLQT